MAVVAEYKLEGGTVVRILDDAYRDISPEEHRRRLDNLNRVAGEILYELAKRQALEKAGG